MSSKTYEIVSWCVTTVLTAFAGGAVVFAMPFAPAVAAACTIANKAIDEILWLFVKDKK